jgi:hypothetical protein
VYSRCVVVGCQRDWLSASLRHSKTSTKTDNGRPDRAGDGSGSGDVKTRRHWERESKDF